MRRLGADPRGVGGNEGGREGERRRGERGRRGEGGTGEEGRFLRRVTENVTID